MSEANEVKNVTSDLIQPRIVEQHTEQMPWGTLFTQLPKDGWNYAVMLVRKYNDYRPPDGLGDIAASREQKGYMTLIVVEPGDNLDWSCDPEACFDGIPCIGDKPTLEDIESDKIYALFQLKNTRTKFLHSYFNLSTPELEAEFISDCFTDMYLKVDEMIYYKKPYETPWYAQRQYIWVD
jgi:hypothetical protein